MPNTAPDSQGDCLARLQVAAAVISNAAGEVLISRRPPGVHQGGLWEFPGGKLERGEDAATALKRELLEELGIEVQQLHPLIRVPHDYTDKAVLLDVWRITAYRGLAHGRESQPIAWVTPERLRDYAFPAANLPIITAARLPACYLITGEPEGAHELFLSRLDHALQRGIRLVQLRAKVLAESDYRRLAQQVLARCHASGARVLLNAAPALTAELGADGVHLSSQRLLALSARPLGQDKWVAASCHNVQELRHACRIGVDFVVVSPVLQTSSHPGVRPLGWEGLRTLTEQAAVPVFALGGMTPAMLDQAWAQGAQGIAAISALWKN